MLAPAAGFERRGLVLLRLTPNPKARRRQYGRFWVTTFFAPSPEHGRFEQQLAELGIKLALPHRYAWACSHPRDRSWFVAVEDADGVACHGVALQASNSRALPGHLLLRVEGFGPALTPEATEAALAGIADIARHEPRILRIRVEVFTRDEGAREMIARVAQGLGFRRPTTARSYSKTIAIDLTPPEADIFAGLHKTARRHVRALEKKGFSVRPIEDPVYAARMDALVRETWRRTGGRFVFTDWKVEIELSTREPSLSRVTGTFQAGFEGPEALVAFAWGCHHGAYASYSTAASTRSASSNVALLYGPTWDLILWARRGGAQWFDLGGVTSGTAADEDPLGGISDFKRYFGREVVTVGDEWILEPHRARAIVANALSSIVDWLRANFLWRP